MPMNQRDVAELLSSGVIDGPTAERISEYLRKEAASEVGALPDPEGPDRRRPPFDLAHAAYYLGGAVILFALGWFATEAWERYGGYPLAGVALGYAALFAALGQALWARGWRIPGGLLFTAAVGMTPLFVFAVQSGLGIWPGPGETWPQPDLQAVDGRVLVIELATLAVALLAARLRPFAFYAAVIAGVVVTLAGTLTPLLAGWMDRGTAEQTMTVIAGAALLGAAYLLDRRTRPDYSFWLYLGGLIPYWVVLTAFHYQEARYVLVNLVFIGLAVLIRRSVFVVAGAVGVFIYLMYLAEEVFQDSLMFPVALSVVGLLFILGGVGYAKRQDRARAWLLARLPGSWAASLPQARQDDGLR